MKQILSLLLTITLFCSFAAPISVGETQVNQTTTSVYICTGGSSTKYHKTSSCKGLNNCKAKIVKVSVKDAENAYGRTACKICKP